MSGDCLKTMGALKCLYLTYSGEIYSKKNSKRIITNARTGRPQIISSERAKNQELEMVWSFRSQLQERGVRWEIGEDSELEVTVFIYQKDRRRRDLDNQLTAILDGLVAANITPDDSNKFVKMLTVAQVGIDKENPRAEIRITERPKL